MWAILFCIQEGIYWKKLHLWIFKAGRFNFHFLMYILYNTLLRWSSLSTIQYICAALTSVFGFQGQDKLTSIFLVIILILKLLSLELAFKKCAQCFLCYPNQLRSQLHNCSTWLNAIDRNIIIKVIRHCCVFKLSWRIPEVHCGLQIVWPQCFSHQATTAAQHTYIIMWHQR